MISIAGYYKPIVAAAVLSVVVSLPGWSQSADLDEMMAELADPATTHWQALERKIVAEWSRSGSAAFDLLLERGKKALEEEKFDIALQHLSALTDHAPEFAEGWNMRATAFFGLKMYGPALEDVWRALELNPRHFGAMTGLAVILQELGYDEAALAAWREVEELHPHRDETRTAIETLSKRVEGQAL